MFPKLVTTLMGRPPRLMGGTIFSGGKVLVIFCRSLGTGWSGWAV